MTGKIYAMSWDGTKVSNNREIADTGLQPATFGQDPTGDLGERSDAPTRVRKHRWTLAR